MHTSISAAAPEASDTPKHETRLDGDEAAAEGRTALNRSPNEFMCKNDGGGGGDGPDWMSDARAAFQTWIRDVGKPGDNPFWDLQFDDNNEEPLDHEKPVVDITLLPFVGRSATENFDVVLTSSDKVLYRGTMKNGRLRGSVDPEMRKLSEWKALLALRVADESNGECGCGTRGGLKEGGSILAEGKLKRGRFHGPVRMFGQMTFDPESLCAAAMDMTQLSFVGRFEDGVPAGHCWRGLLGGAWITGVVDQDGEFSGADIAYVYPDMKTAFRGSFKKGIMVDAKEALVSGAKCESGLLRLHFSQPVSGKSFRYDPPSATSFGDQPLVGDPLDNRYVFLFQSLQFPSAGEGLFAREDIPPDTVFVLYGGHVLTDAEMKDFMEEEQEANRRANIGLTDPAATAKWMYRHHIKPCNLRIDIPPEYGTADNFRATLGHKVNHKFDPTAVYTHIDSARFGMVNAVKTKPDVTVRQDEELFVNYGYSLNVALPWFNEQFAQFRKEQPQLAKQMMDRANTCQRA